MAVYIVLAVLSAALGIPLCGAVKRKTGKGSIVYCICLCVLLTLISAVRHSVGYDYNLYASMYYKLNFTDFEETGLMSREKGLLFPLKILNTFFADYPPAFVLISLMIYPPLMYCIYKFSDNPWVSVSAFIGAGLFFNSLNFMSQFIAAILCAYAFERAAKGHFGRFAVLVLAALSFHRSAVIILPCFLFAYIGWNYITLGITVAAAGGAYVFSEEIIRFATRFFYSNYDIDRSVELSRGLPVWYAVMFGVLFAALFLTRKRMSGEKGELNVILWCGFFSFFFELIGTKYGLISRFALLFFIPAVCLGVPKLLAAGEELFGGEGKKKGTVLAVSLFIAAAAVTFSYLMSVNYNGVLPYRTIFSGE